MSAFLQLKVSAVIAETAEACSLALDVPPELAFSYRPGQYVTVRVPREVDGRVTSIARCYSFSSSPDTGELPMLTVKRMPGGYASNWICDHITAGSLLDVMPPAGSFTPSTWDRDLLLFAGGSGITPVISILKSALARGDGHNLLVYANRDAQCVIFAGELRRLADAHPTRLQVVEWLDVTQGPPTAAGLQSLISGYADREAFICGPVPFMATARQALSELGVTDQRIHIEQFFPEANAVVEADDDTTSGTVEVTLEGATYRYPWPTRTRLLDLLLSKGLNAPFSCRQGTCGACAVRLVRGEVELLHNEVLEDEDFADGYILACQAVPLTDEVTVTY